LVKWEVQVSKTLEAEASSADDAVERAKEALEAEERAGLGLEEIFNWEARRKF